MTLKMCLTLHTQRGFWGWVGGGRHEMSAYFCSWRLLPDAQSAELSGREREGALYEASCSVCSTFSGFYSSAVTQSVIFKRSIYWEQAELFYRVLWHLNQVLLLNWYNNKLGEKQQQLPDVCCLICIKLPNWRRTHAVHLCTFLRPFTHESWALTCFWPTTEKKQFFTTEVTACFHCCWRNIYLTNQWKKWWNKIILNTINYNLESYVAPTMTGPMRGVYEIMQERPLWWWVCICTFKIKQTKKACWIHCIG